MISDIHDLVVVGKVTFMAGEALLLFSFHRDMSC